MSGNEDERTARRPKMKFLHVTIQTNRFQDEVDFYEKYVGLTVQQDMRPMGKNMVFLANHAGETCVEIIENQEAVSSGTKHLSIGFETGDTEAMRARMLETGLNVSPIISPMPQVQFFFVTDPAGVNVQFI